MLSYALIAIGVVLLLVAGGLFIRAQIGYSEAQSTYAELQQYAVVSDEGDAVPTVDFDALAAINPDVVGWIYIPNTPVNYPVVQTDNNTTYLTRLFDGSGNGSGTIFMDMDDAAPGMVDEQTTLYGHHMNDGKMFKIIDNTIDQATFDTIGTVYYITPHVTYELKPMFTAQVEETYTAARTPNFTGTGDTLQSYLRNLYAYAKAEAADASERIDQAAHVMSLVTCAGEIIPRTTRAVMVLDIAAAYAH
ncbi:class B sortase [Collinsella tanakaei]|nr:class B sortase [Collinsella tanakaei]